MQLEPVGAQQLFSAIAGNDSSQLESIAEQAIQNGIDSYQQGDYEKAETEFRRAAGMANYTSFGGDAYKYLGMTYEQMGEPEKMIKVYEEAVERFPDRADLKIDLGNQLYQQERYAEAEKVYREALRIDSNNSNKYALGQALLQTGKLNEAEDLYREIIRSDSEDSSGYYGLGETYAKMERYEEAIDYFQKATDLKDEFWDAYLEMGFAYADLGDMDKAQEIFEMLEETSEDLADVLSRYMYKTDTPKIAFASSTSTLYYNLPPKTALSALDSYLATAGAEKQFTMVFQFDKEMDRESVENPYNWYIRRAQVGGGSGGLYNYGLSIADNEAQLPFYPDSVYWDADNFTATVRFTLGQNEDADAVIHTGGIEFQFVGQDIYGNDMDSASDQFSGFSGVY